MFKFIRDALSEFEHVVWPTPTETRKYMYYNVTVIIVLTIFLMILGYVIQQSLIFARGQFPHDTIIDTVSSEDQITASELENVTKELKKSINQSGATNTGTTVIVSTGAKAQ